MTTDPATTVAQGQVTVEELSLTEGSFAEGALLVVHAHPDDETLATGALLATWAAAGRAVTLVTCTRGERGEVIGADPEHLEGDGPALAAHRENELAAALEALGVQDHVFLDALPVADSGPHPAARFEDSGMAWVGAGAAGTSGQAGAAAELPANALVGVPVDEAAARLADLLRDRRPAVVVTYEPGGGYGHPDHVRAHEITVRALDLAAVASATCPAHVPDHVWWPVIPPTTLRQARAELAAPTSWADVEAAEALEDLLAAEPSAVLPDPAGPLPAVAEPARPVVVAVPLSPVHGRVAAALAAHATQVHWIHRIARPGVRVVTGAAPGAADPTSADLRPEVRLAGWYALSNDVLVPWLDHELYADARAESDGTPDRAAEDTQRTSSENG